MTSKSADSEGNQKQSPALQKAFKRNVEALVSFEEARKSIWRRWRMSLHPGIQGQSAQSSPLGCCNTTTLSWKGWKRELNQSTTLWERTSCMCLCNNGIALKSSLTVLRNDCSLFSRLYIACQTGKGDLPEFLRHENQPPSPPLSRLGDKRTGKTADLLKCLERSPLPSGNADEEEVLVDETNNIDYEETVEPVTSLSEDIAILKSFPYHQWNWAWTMYAGRGTTDQQRHFCIHCCWFSSRRPIWSRCENPWWCFCCWNALPQDIKHFPDHNNCVFLPYILAQLQSVQRLDIVWDVYLADRLNVGARGKRVKVNAVRCYLWHHYLPPGKASWGMMRTRVTSFLFFPKKLKELKFLAKYRSPLPVTAWSHYPQNQT